MITSKLVARDRELGTPITTMVNVLDLQLRGEYLYAAMGNGGFRIYDVANIDNKDFSERIDDRAGFAAGPAVLREDEIAMAVATPVDAGGRSAADAASPKTKSRRFTRCMVFFTWPIRKKAWSSSAIPI